MIFLKIKLWFHELFVFKIPKLWERIKESFENDFWKTIGLVMILIVIPIGIYEGVQYHKVLQAKQEEKTINKKIAENNQIMNIKEEGPEKYLEEQLGVNNKTQVIKMFNKSAKWQNRYDEVITHCTEFTKNSQYRNYLNPIIKNILNGELVSQNKANFNFAKTYVDPESDEATNGVMMILISSKDEDQVSKIQKLIDSHPDYKVVVFDKESPNGETNFNNCMLGFLEATSGMRSGYDANNSWTGVAYAFNDNQPVFHTKSLDEVLKLKKLPDKSLSHNQNDKE